MGSSQSGMSRQAFRSRLARSPESAGEGLISASGLTSLRSLGSILDDGRFLRELFLGEAGVGLRFGRDSVYDFIVV